MKSIILIPVLLLITSCQLFMEPMPKSWNWGIKPRPLTGMRNFPSTDTEYGKGFRHGCEVGWGAVGKGFITEVVKKKYDFKRMQQSPDYNTGWFDGYEQCVYILDNDIV